MRTRVLGLLSLILLPSAALAQAPGVALNAGHGLDNGMGVNWTFKENWTLRPTIGAGYSQQTGFQARVGSSILRSFGASHRVYGYIGAGLFANRSGATSNLNPTQPTSSQIPGQSAYSSSLTGRYEPSSFYFTTPVGLRARIYGNFEAFAEAAYQKTLSGTFATTHAGQFSGNTYQRFGATFGISMRLGG